MAVYGICQFLDSISVINWRYIVSFLPKILGRNQDFPKDSVWGGESLFKVPGEKGFLEGIQIFRFLPGGSLVFDNLQCL